jgi:hypothetical protein
MTIRLGLFRLSFSHFCERCAASPTKIGAARRKIPTPHFCHLFLLTYIGSSTRQIKTHVQKSGSCHHDNSRSYLIKRTKCPPKMCLFLATWQRTRESAASGISRYYRVAAAHTRATIGVSAHFSGCKNANKGNENGGKHQKCIFHNKKSCVMHKQTRLQRAIEKRLVR